MLHAITTTVSFRRRFDTHAAASLVCTIASLLCTSRVAAEDSSRFETGRDIFQHEWAFEPNAAQDIRQAVGTGRRGNFLEAMRSMRGDGLGPMHNAISCESCHAFGGGAGIDRNVTLLTLDPRNELIAKNGDKIRRTLLDLYPALLARNGTVLMDVVVHEKSTRPFYQEIRAGVGKHIPGGAPENWFDSSKRTTTAVAEQPVLAGRIGRIDFYLSQRNSPALYGAGLIEKIETSKLHAIAKSQAKWTDGRITGRVGVGKFGWRGQTATLAQFVRGACAGELGLQTVKVAQPADVADSTYRQFGSDLSEYEVAMLVSHVSAIRRPMEESGNSQLYEMVQDGKKLFKRIGCLDCHVESVVPARGIYSDLLLHDLGHSLQAPSPAPTSLASSRKLTLPRFTPNGLRPSKLLPSLRPQREQSRGSRSFKSGYSGGPVETMPIAYPLARPDEPRFPRGKVPEAVIQDETSVTWDSLQREWRTPPLWGVADSAPYLHDGRAATLDAAIRWHAGEAQDAAEKYRSLPPHERDKVIAFLSTLRAPPPSNSNRGGDRIVPPVALALDTNPIDQLQRMAESINVFAP
jgi:CxxC motif-containing protein (DUF1111 family)